MAPRPQPLRTAIPAASLLAQLPLPISLLNSGPAGRRATSPALPALPAPRDAIKAARRPSRGQPVRLPDSLLLPGWGLPAGRAAGGPPGSRRRCRAGERGGAAVFTSGRGAQRRRRRRSLGEGPSLLRHGHQRPVRQLQEGGCGPSAVRTPLSRGGAGGGPPLEREPACWGAAYPQRRALLLAEAEETGRDRRAALAMLDPGAGLGWPRLFLYRALGSPVVQRFGNSSCPRRTLAWKLRLRGPDGGTGVTSWEVGGVPLSCPSFLHCLPLHFPLMFPDPELPPASHQPSALD